MSNNTEESVPADRCMLLVLEFSKVEVAVLLNELARLRYEASKNQSSNLETFLLKQTNLAIIKLISNIGGDKVRVVGSFLAETPLACKEKVRELLGYMLSIKGDDELCPFYSVRFLLPMLCQIMREDNGCNKVFVSTGAYKAVVECFIKLIGLGGRGIHDNGSILLACDTVMNLLLKRDQIQVPLDDACFVRLLGAFTNWTSDIDDLSVIMMASTICVIIFDSTSEEALLQHPGFDRRLLIGLSQLIVRSLAMFGKEMILDEAKAGVDLH
ncbi:hypothetical protein Vadar_006535 [Vaccinium darrowii]|uniref:Uncharacterized protein n=1 Tax=Vaccinium darrowii TaxID=229202 RepID=A0ACB7Z252_9ERIC|nr:hypothetical protein Vadar_006535 [Vaccinium darrowii]